MTELTAAELGWGGVVMLVVMGLAYLAIKTAVRSSVERAVDRKFRQWEVRFTTLHERRVEAMAELWKRLATTKLHLEAAAGPRPLNDPRGRDRLMAATEAASEASTFLSTHRLFLPKELIDKIEEALTKMKGALGDLTTWALHDDQQPDPERTYDKMGRAGRQAVKDLAPLILQLEEAFRNEVEGSTIV